MAYELVCSKCGAHWDSSRYRLYCQRCGSLLNISYENHKLTGSRIVAGSRGLARYLSLLPIYEATNLVTLGEGETPVVSLSGTGRLLGLDNLYGKLEFCNPTGSFKDRGNAVQVTVLRETGVTEVVEVTIGNAGQSFAAYCARAGIHCTGFVGIGQFDEKTKAMAIHGAELRPIEGDRETCFDAARTFAHEKGILFMNYSENSYFIEGQKTISFELVDQMDPLPEHILAPAGNGSIILGLWRGFKNMLEDGRVGRIPRLHAVQTAETRPIVAGFYGQDWRPVADVPTSVAVGIGIATPPRLEDVVAAIRESGGLPITVSEEEILNWQRLLAQEDGLLVEPTSAVVLAAADNLRSAGVIHEADSVLLLLTASGMKESLSYQ